MKSIFFFICFFLPSSSLFALHVSEVSNPRNKGNWISDHAKVIADFEEMSMNIEIDVLEKETGVEIAIVTVNEASGTATPKDFATNLFQHWGIGKEKNHNGLLILFVKDARRIEMETGYGMETILPDNYLKKVQMTSMVPAFKRGNYSEGLNKGLSKIITRIRTNKDGILDEMPGVQKSQHQGEGGGTLIWLLSLLGGAGLLVGGGAMYHRKKKRTCPECKRKLLLLGEEEDDEKLDPGQVTEEILGSVDYQIWYCEHDGFSKMIRMDKWFSGFKTCHNCAYKTMTVKSTTVTRATTYTSGTEAITESCAHCDHVNTWHRTIPRLQSSGGFGGGGGSFGGGDSGGSFGGGSSGGGGSGSSW